jgi:hypothetical protein
MIDLATPAGTHNPPARAEEPALAGGSQALSVWPALRAPKRESSRRLHNGQPEPGEPPEPRRRRSGTALAYRLLAVIAIAVAVGAITLGAAGIPWANSPEETTLGDVNPDATATLDPAQDNPAGAATAPGTNPLPATPGSPQVTDAPPTQALVIPLQVSFTITNKLLLSYTVNVSITNSAAVGQAWQSVSVLLGGINLVVTAIGSLVDLDLIGTDACATPAGSATISAGQTLQFSFNVTGVNLAVPTVALLNQPVCN